MVLIGAVGVLPRLFNDVYTPSAVLGELSHPKAPHLVREWAQSPPGWLKVLDPSSRLASTARLDVGEAHAISLAKELHIVDILIDERDGRKVARAEGLFPLPTLAVIELAGEKQLLDLVEVIAALRKTNIRIPDAHFDAVLKRHADHKSGQS